MYSADNFYCFKEQFIEKIFFNAILQIYKQNMPYYTHI